MDNTQLGEVSLEVSDAGVGTITFSHPAHNSLPSKLLAKLADTIRSAGDRADIRVLVLKSAGDRTFCAGASFDELASIEDLTVGKHFFSGFANVINACRESSKIVIGRVQGKAIGGGVGLAAATDYCFATTASSVKLSELAVGIGPFVVGPAVERKIGLSAFSMMTLQATEFQTAHWALQKGLFYEIFDTVEAMDEAVAKLAHRLAASSPEALSMLKKIFWEGTEHWGTLLIQRAEMSGKLVLTDYAKTAINKFKSS